METKKIIGTVLTIFGGLAIILGVFGIFEGKDIAGISPWAPALVGLLFFSSGISLVQAVRPQKTDQ